MMAFLSILISTCVLTFGITGVLIDSKRNDSTIVILTFFLSAVIGLAAIIAFMVGHFVGM